MQFVLNFIGWQVLTQAILIVLWFGYEDLVTTAFVIYRLSPAYFYFVVIALFCLIWLGWTAVSAALGVRKLGFPTKRETLRRSR